MESKRDIATKLFMDGYNCSQSIVGAFYKEMNLDFETAIKIASGFGGGMGRLREVCGAVSGMFMVLGAISQYTSPDNKEEKMELYKNVQNLAESFKERNSVIVCRELLKNIKTTSGYVPDERTKEYYKIRPCIKFVGDAAEILEKYLNTKKAQ